MHVRPLTHCGTDGHVLKRPPDVEAQIVTVLGLDQGELRRRTSITDRGHADYLKDETLVYLLREAYRAEDLAWCELFADALSRRCIPYARKHFRSFDEQGFEDAHRDLLDKVLEMILGLESDSGDFLQVRFGRKVRFLALDIFDRYAPQLSAAQDQDLLSSSAGYDGSVDDRRRHSLPAELQARNENDRRLIANELLQRLREPHRTAFILKHYDGWPIQSKKAGTPSISAFFNVDPRTIQNWLTAAEKALETWRGQQS